MWNEIPPDFLIRVETVGHACLLFIARKKMCVGVCVCVCKREWEKLPYKNEGRLKMKSPKKLPCEKREREKKMPNHKQGKNNAFWFMRKSDLLDCFLIFCSIFDQMWEQNCHKIIDKVLTR